MEKTEARFTSVCAWCKRRKDGNNDPFGPRLDKVKEFGPKEVTHGMCNECALKIRQDQLGYFYLAATRGVKSNFFNWFKQ
jgi:hypothetical protein